MRGNPWALFVLHSDVCCDFPVKEMMLFQQSLANRKGFVILGMEVNTRGDPLPKNLLFLTLILCFICLR